MAIIGEIRKRYWLLVGIIGVALLLFVLSDFQRKRNKQDNTIGVIAGEKIAITEFNLKVEENSEMQKTNSGKDNLTAEDNYQVRQQTWQQVVNEIIMDKQYDMLGVSVSVESVVESVLSGPLKATVSAVIVPVKVGVSVLALELTAV